MGSNGNDETGMSFPPGMAETMKKAHGIKDYFLVGPDGSRIQVTPELFSAMSYFLSGSKRSGSVTTQFRNGGIAGVEAKMVLKG